MTDAPFDPVADEGVALERTSLAWNRTGLAFATAGAVGFRFVEHGHVAAAALLLLAAVSWVNGQARYRSARAPANARVLAVVAYGTSAVAAFAAFAAWLSSAP